MSFKRIRLIFIIAFVLLDLVLLGSYLWGTNYTTAKSTDDEQTALLKELKNDSITVPALSQRRQSGYYLSAKQDGQLTAKTTALRGVVARTSGELTVATYQHPVRLGSRTPTEVLAYLTRHHRLKYGGAYRYQARRSSKTTLVYAQQLAGRPVSGDQGELRIRLNKHGAATGFTQGHLTAVKRLRARQQTLSQLAVVGLLYKNNQLSANTTVKAVTLGYARLTSQGDQDVYVPTWVARVKNSSSTSKQTLRINAFKGTIVKE